MPQLENGYFKIANELWDALVRYRIPGEQRQCLDFIIRKTYGFNKKEDHISNSQFCEGTGLQKSNVSRAIRNLIDKNIILKIEGRRVPIYRINKQYGTWALLERKKTTKEGGCKNLEGRVNLEEIKDSIRDRDDHTCCLCQFKAHRAKKKLSVHHIDFNQTNNELSNLITLCVSCHAKSHNRWEKEKLQKIMLSKLTTVKQGEKELSKTINENITFDNNKNQRATPGDDNLNTQNHEQIQGPDSPKKGVLKEKLLLSKVMDTKDSNNVTKDRGNPERVKTKISQKTILLKMRILSSIISGNQDHGVVGNYGHVGESFPEMQVRAKRELDQLKRDIKK